MGAHVVHENYVSISPVRLSLSEIGFEQNEEELDAVLVVGTLHELEEPYAVTDTGSHSSVLCSNCHHQAPCL